MYKLLNIVIWGIWVQLLLTTCYAQNINESINKQLIEINKLTDNYVVYKKLDSLNQIKGLSIRNKVEVITQLASVAIKIQKFDEAAKLSYEGVDLAEKNNLDTAHSFFYKIIGGVNYYLGKYPEAIKHFKRSAAIAKQKNILYLEVMNYQNLGGVFIDSKLHDSAKIYLLKAIKMSAICGSKCTIARLLAFRLLGTLYENQKDYYNAEKLYITAEKEAQMTNDTTLICSFLIYRSDLLYKLGQKQNAIEKASLAVKLMKHQKGRNDHSYTAALHHLSKKLADCGRYKEAYELRIESSNYIAQNYRKEGLQQVNELEAKYKTKEIEQERNLAQANALAESRKKELLLLILIVVLLIATLITALIFFYNKKNKADAKVKEQQAILTAIFETQEIERSRIAKDLHDGIVQDLTAIKMSIKSAYQIAPNNLHQELNTILSELDTATKEVREISYQMMPVTLKELGLVKALNELLNRSFVKNNIEFDLNYFGLEERLNENIETTVYRICQELINNTIKHSQATHVSLLLQIRNNTLLFTYEDNGIGFNSKQVKKGIGLNSLNTRIEMVQGSLEFDASETTGTTAYIRIPL
ncbi:MAG: tetratricopeptide repeat-containing sensor histidine kinase [Chitinophagaceae bacterium]